jgi:hypothetical protein
MLYKPPLIPFLSACGTFVSDTHPPSHMSESHVDEQPLTDSPPPGTTFPDDPTYGFSDVPADATHDYYQSLPPPQIITTCADEAPTHHHAPWASNDMASEVNPPSVPGPKKTLHCIAVGRMCHRPTRARDGEPGLFLSFEKLGKFLSEPIRSLVTDVSLSFEWRRRFRAVV